MKMLLLLAVTMFLIGSPGVANQRAPSPPPDDPAVTIAGVGLGSTLGQLHARLGAPTGQVVRPDDPEMGKLIELQYPGVRFELCEPAGKQQFHVWRLTVTGQNCLVEPGLRVGMSRADVLRVLGPPSSVEQNSATGHETLHYSFTKFDGWYWLVLGQGKVTEIGAAEDWS